MLSSGQKRGKMKSPSHEEVVQCLKNTPKGRLRYNSGGESSNNVVNRVGPFSVSSQKNHDKPAKLVVPVSSPPDQRKLKSVLPMSHSTNNYKRIPEPLAEEEKIPQISLMPKRNGSGKEVPSPSAKKTLTGTEKIASKGTETVQSPIKGLHVSNLADVGLLCSYKIALEEKARDEVQMIKENFKLGLDKIQTEIRRENTDSEKLQFSKYQSEVNDIDETLNRIQIEDEQVMNSLKASHSRRSLLASKTSDSIRRKQQEIDAERKAQDDARKLRFTLSQKLESTSFKIRELSLEILGDLQTHGHNLSSGINELSNDVKSMLLNAMTIAKQAIHQQLTLEEACEFHEKTMVNLLLYKNKIAQEIEKANERQKQEEEKKEQERKAEEIKALEEKRAQEAKLKEVQDQAASNPQVAQPAAQITSQSQAMTLFVSQDAYAVFKEVVKFQEQVSNSFVSLKTVQEKKAYRFDLTKLINTAINAISDQSPDHLGDKIERLTKLLQGDVIEVGGKRISAKDDPAGLAYCMDTVAKKLVLQGSRQISSSFNSAFAFGAVALGIWSAFPEVGKLMLAHFYIACPYLVPYYVPKSPEQSTADYCKTLGYEVNGEDVESEDKYLKKLSGIVRLYASIVQTPMPPGLSSAAHPHGLHNGWTWLSRLVNLDARQTVTATVLFDFLEVAGYALSQAYGKQFQKMLRLFCQEFLPKIDQVTPEDQKGPVVRLKIFLEKCMKSGSIPIAEGYLSSRWWKGGGQTF